MTLLNLKVDLSPISSSLPILLFTLISSKLVSSSPPHPNSLQPALFISTPNNNILSFPISHHLAHWSALLTMLGSCCHLLLLVCSCSIILLVHHNLFSHQPRHTIATDNYQPFLCLCGQIQFMSSGPWQSTCLTQTQIHHDPLQGPLLPPILKLLVVVHARSPMVEKKVQFPFRLKNFDLKEYWITKNRIQD